jgi:hypothetical protein
MPVAGGGFEQAYNAQATVASGSLLVVTADVAQAANDKRQIAPTLDQLDHVADALGKPETLLADSGYFSEANVERHHRSWKERFAAAAPPAPDTPTPLEAMVHRLASPEGRRTYALRKQILEPVFGIIKAVMAFANSPCAALNRLKANGTWSPSPGT